MKDPRYAADREQRRLDGATTNPNSTPVGKGRQQAAQEMQAAQTGGQPAAAPSITPRLDSNPARNNAVAVATANRNGAFGTGAQNLQDRRDLYQQMAADPGAIDNPAYKARAQALGVTEKGWANAGNRLGAWGTGAAPPATVAAAPAITPAAPRQPAQNALANTAPAPEIPPAAPLPNQTPAAPAPPLPAITNQAPTPTATLPDKVANGGTSTPRNKPSFINQAKNWLGNYLMRP